MVFWQQTCCWGICLHQPWHRSSVHLHLCPLHSWGVSGRKEFTHTVHCKKRLTIFPLLSLTKLSLAGKKLMTTRESLVSDIPAGDGKTANLFLQCTLYQQRTCYKDSTSGFWKVSFLHESVSPLSLEYNFFILNSFKKLTEIMQTYVYILYPLYRRHP